MNYISWSSTKLVVILACVASLWGGYAQAQGNGLAFGTPERAAVETTGSLVVVDSLLNAVVRVDPATGNRTIVSGGEAGIGPGFSSPEGIAIGAGGVLLVVDRSHGAVMRVDPATGNRTIVSGDMIGTGPAFIAPEALAINATGALLVVDQNLDAVIRVDPATGNRTIVSDDTIGTGPVFFLPGDIVVEGSGALLVADHGLDAVVRVDPTTGNRTIVSGCAQFADPCAVPVVGNGTPFEDPVSIGIESTGALLVIDTTLNAVIRVDPTTGNRTPVSDITRGSGPFLLSPVDIVVRPNGPPVVVDADRQALIQVDPATGNRTFLSKAPTLIISPPSGPYATFDGVELAIITEGLITEVLEVSAELDGVDVTPQLETCGEAIRLPSGEFILRCPNVGELLGLGLGRHTFSAQLFVRVGDQGIQPIENNVVWDILVTTGPGPEPGTGTETETDTATGTETETDTATGTETETDTATGTETETDT